MVMRKILFVCVLFSLLLAAEKLEITADQFSARDVDKKVSFVGHAKIVQGRTTVRAERVILYFNEDNTTKMYRALNGVKFHIQKSKANYRGSCQKMIYLPDSKTYILTGSVKVKDQTNKREISAQKIEIHSSTGAFRIEGDKRRAAKLTFEIK